MTLQEFKKANDITSINLYKSNSTSRYVGSAGNFKLVTSEEFDGKKPAFVYDAPAELASDDPNLRFLSNKEPREADMVL